jgi:hypothetical protein
MYNTTATRLFGNLDHICVCALNVHMYDAVISCAVQCMVMKLCEIVILLVATALEQQQQLSCSSSSRSCAAVAAAEQQQNQHENALKC